MQNLIINVLNTYGHLKYYLIESFLQCSYREFWATTALYSPLGGIYVWFDNYRHVVASIWMQHCRRKGHLESQTGPAHNWQPGSPQNLPPSRIYCGKVWESIWSSPVPAGGARTLVILPRVAVSWCWWRRWAVNKLCHFESETKNTESGNRWWWPRCNETKQNKSGSRNVSPPFFSAAILLDPDTLDPIDHDHDAMQRSEKKPP